MDGVKVISAKSEGKGNTKVVFDDRIAGPAGNGISEKMIKVFIEKGNGDTHLRTLILLNGSMANQVTNRAWDIELANT